MAISPNETLRTLVELHGLSLRDLMELTGRSRTMVYGWLCPERSKHYKPMRQSDLRLIALELGLSEPSRPVLPPD